MASSANHHRVALDDMRAWLLDYYGTTIRWKAAQVSNLAVGWTCSELLRALPTVIRSLSNTLDLPPHFLSKLDKLSPDVRKALKGQDVTPAARKRTHSFLVGRHIGFNGDVELLNAHVLEGDAAAAAVLWWKEVDLLLLVVETPGALRPRLLEAGVRVRHDSTRLAGLSRALEDSAIVAVEVHDDVIYYLDSDAVMYPLDVLMLRVKSAFPGAQRRERRRQLEFRYINEETETAAAAWWEVAPSVWWNSIETVAHYVDLIERYLTFWGVMTTHGIQVVPGDIVLRGESMAATKYWVAVVESLGNPADDAEDTAAECAHLFSRFCDLKHLLLAHGLAWEDSELCQQYIEDGVGAPSNIVRVMTTMRFFAQDTDYESILRAIRARRNHCCGRRRHAESGWAKKIALFRYVNATTRDSWNIPDSLMASIQNMATLQKAAQEFDELVTTDECHGMHLCADCLVRQSDDDISSDSSEESVE